MNLRAHAALTLAPVLRGEQSLQSLFEPAVNKLEAKDRPYFHELIYGSLRQYESLEAAFKQLVSKKIKNKDADIKALILLGLYQLEHMHTPDHAVISESVKAVAVLKKHWAKGLVNAVLRNYQRQHEAILAHIQASAAHLNLPHWLVEKLKQDWPEQWQSVAEHIQYQPPVTLRNNASLGSRADALGRLHALNIECTETPYSTHGITLANSGDISSLNDIETGRLSVQDEAAQLAAPLLALENGQRVLDACAAPGGKTGHILESASSLQLTALELEPERASRIHENLARLKQEANVIIADAINLDAWFDGNAFDRILLDAPCSATGVIRRHPDIKLLRREDDLAKLADVQLTMLKQLWRCLKPGGVLVYATCSILKQENENIVAAFVDEQPGAQHVVIEARWGLARAYGRQLFPKQGSHDGFYYAKLYKEQ